MRIGSWEDQEAVAQGTGLVQMVSNNHQHMLEHILVDIVQGIVGVVGKD